MSRDHSSRPEKSNAFRTPVPVITQTERPSVTGEGDDMLCLRIVVLPPPRGRVQTVAPVPRSSAHNEIASPSATFRKIRWPETIGVDPLRSGSGRFQATFSVAVHRKGRPFSTLTPLREGPRQCGQSSAATPADTVPRASPRIRADFLMVDALPSSPPFNLLSQSRGGLP